MPEGEFLLRSFNALDAEWVTSWVRSADEAFMLAPGTPAPLTSAKVIAWTARRGQGYMIRRRGEPGPLGYAELNPMTTNPTHFWIGHVVLDPARRGIGLGRALTNALCEFAFVVRRASRLTLVVFPSNVAAIRCYCACGFRQVQQEFQRFQGRRYRLLRFERLALSTAQSQSHGGVERTIADSAANSAGSGGPPPQVR